MVVGSECNRDKDIVEIAVTDSDGNEHKAKVAAIDWDTDPQGVIIGILDAFEQTEKIKALTSKGKVVVMTTEDVAIRRRLK